MPVLGVLTCQILELEIAYLLKNDKSISTIFVINNDAGQGFITALEKNNITNFISLKAFDEFYPSKDGTLNILVHVLELGLHSHKYKLQQALIKETQNIGQYVDALFLGYGLCGNALENPNTLFAHMDIPFFLPQDKDHPVDDCVGLFIGGRDNYYAEQLKEAGTFFMTPGWTTHWKSMFEKDFGNMSNKMAKRIFKHYKRTLLISNPVMEESQMKENIHEFNSLFHCYSDISQGSMDMLTDAWQTAKAHVMKISCKTRYPNKKVE